MLQIHHLGYQHSDPEMIENSVSHLVSSEIMAIRNQYLFKQTLGPMAVLLQCPIDCSMLLKVL